jgi:hypothetical protein
MYMYFIEIGRYVQRKGRDDHMSTNLSPSAGKAFSFPSWKAVV